MELIKPGTKIEFVKYRYVAMAMSGLVILASIVSLVIRGGPSLGVDFSGGIAVQVKFHQEVKTAAVRGALLDRGYGQVLVQQFGNAGDNEFLVRVEMSDEALPVLQKKIEQVLAEKFGQGSFDVRRTEIVGPKVGAELRKKGFLAVFYSLFGILIYVSWRFEFRFALGAVVAVFHDAMITVGIFSIMNKDIDLQIVAAVLTIIGYSVNDTIVVFDRVRENMRKTRKQSLEKIIDLSVNETLSRTLFTNLTVFLTVLALFFLGGPVLHDFSFALVIGMLAGTYSTIYIASPVVLLWEKLRPHSSTAPRPNRGVMIKG